MIFLPLLFLPSFLFSHQRKVYFILRSLSLRLCLFLLAIFIILSKDELFQLIFAFSIGLLFLTVALNFLLAFKFLNQSKSIASFVSSNFILFSILLYATAFSIFSFCFYLILENNVDTIVINNIFLRWTIAQITILFYLLFIFSIFLLQSKNEHFSFSKFQSIFLEFLPSLFFGFLQSSFIFLLYSLSFNFAIIFILANFIFCIEVKTFYEKFWTPQIRNSSFLWHLLRFSSVSPFFLYDFIIYEISWAGATISLETLPQGRQLLSTRSSYTTRLSYHPKVLRNFQIRSTKDLIGPTQKLISSSLEKDPTNFRALDRGAFKECGLFTKSELFNHGAECPQAISISMMDGFSDKHLLPTGLKFFEESLFALSPTWTKTLEAAEISKLLEYRHKNAPDFTALALAKDGTYLFSKTGVKVTNEELEQDSFKDLFDNSSIVWNYKAIGKPYNNALRLKVYDALVLNSDLAVSQQPIELKVKPFKPVEKSTAQLSLLDTSTKEHVLYADFQKSKIVASRYIADEDFSKANVSQFLEKRRFLLDSMQNEKIAIKIKIEVAQKAIEDFEKTNNNNK